MKVINVLWSFIVIVFCAQVVQADTYEAKYNTAQWLPVVVLDGVDGITPETGVVYTGVTFWYKEGLNGTWTQLTLALTSCTATSGYWCEESATNAPGSYRVYVPATVTDTKGKLFYIVKGTGYKTYWGQLSVTANTAAEDPIADILIDTGTSGVLISDGTGAGQIDTASGAIVTVNSATLAAATHTGAVIPTVTTLTNDAGITQAGADKVWGTTARTVTGGTIGTYTGNTPQTGDSFARLGAPAGASVSADIATRSTFNATTDAVDLDFTLACPVTQTAGTVGDACKTSADSTAQTGDVYPLASTEIADIKAKTDLIPADPADASDIAALLSPIQADTDNIQTRTPAALIGGKMDSDMTAISGDTAAADNLESEHDGTGYMGSGIAVSPTTDADTSGNLWRTIEITETGIITANDDHIGKYLWCGKEFSEIMKTVQGVTDTITVDPAEPFGTAQTSGTCYVK